MAPAPPGAAKATEATAGTEATATATTGDALARRARRVTTTTAVLVTALVLVALVSVMLGQYVIAPAHVWSLIAHGPSQETTEASIVWNVRLPRIALGLVVGSALGAGGALMQALFANPLAEPGVIGVSSGAAVGASAAIVFGAGILGPSTVPAAAFVTGVATTLLIYRLARVRGRTHALALVLVGVSINAVAGAITSFVTYLASSTARDQVVFWQMGSLNNAAWGQVAVTAPLVLLSLAGATLLAPQLDVLALGERAATQTGVDVGRLRRAVVVLTALLTAAAVAYAGIISFVGLIVPHVLRLVLGPRNRALIPLSALGGACLIMAADLGARTVIPYTDLPIGVFTALAGGPTFFILLRRTIVKGGLA